MWFTPIKGVVYQIHPQLIDVNLFFSVYSLLKTHTNNEGYASFFTLYKLKIFKFSHHSIKNINAIRTLLSYKKKRLIKGVTCWNSKFKSNGSK